MHTYRFFDGKIANPHEVSVAFLLDKIIGKNQEGEILFAWCIDSVQVLQAPEYNRLGLVTCQYDNTARLHVDDIFMYQLDQLSGKPSRKFSISTKGKSLLFWTAIACIFIWLVFLFIPKLSPYIAQQFPESWEESLADYALDYIAGDGELCVQEDAIDALNKMVDYLARDTAIDSQVDIKVVYDDTVNAFATPANRIVLFSGLIDSVEDQTEIAGVIAHEMGHVIEKHPTEGFVRGLSLLFVVQFMMGNIGSIGDVGIIGQALYELDYSRDAELEADRLALKILHDKGIDPSGFRNFFERIKEEELDIESDFLTYFSTHPKTSDRIDMIELDRQEQHYYHAPLTEEEWQQLKQVCKVRSRVNP